jgi:HK97 family phage major capsid protein
MPHPDYAHAQLEIKSVDASRRIIEGFASTITPDRGGDVMVPEGAQYSLPIPLLWEHGRPIGEVFDVQVIPGKGIKIKARISNVHVPGEIKDFVDQAWAALSATPPLVRGLSIGWKPIEAAQVAGTKLRKVAKWIWGELSTVVVPMNAEATITAIKSFDAASLASSGNGLRVPSTPGVPGLRKAEAMKNQIPYAEQIETLETARATKSARLEELRTKAATDGGLDAEETTERKGLTLALQHDAEEMTELKALEASQASAAVSVFSSPAIPAAQRQMAPRVEVVPLPKGTLFTRYAMAIAAGKGSISDTIAYAKRWEGQTPELVKFIKTAVPGSTVVESPGWGAEMVYAQNLASEFAELLRPETIIGRISGFRMTPFNVRVLVQTLGSTVNWVGEKAAKPVTELDFTTVTMAYDKIAGIIVLTEELIRLGTPSAEQTVRQDLISSISAFMDAQFVLPSVSATANNPASVTNAVTPVPASGTDLADLFTDVNDALAAYDTANIPTSGLYIVTTPTVARGISALRNSLGIQDSQVAMTPNGGTIMGYTVLTSNSVPAGDIVFIQPKEILLADDGRVTLDSSNQATLDMAGGNSPTFNLWQKNCVGIRAERWITWKKRRSEAVQIITGAAYAPA